VSIPMNFYTWWLLISFSCPLFVLIANIGMRGVGMTGVVLTKNQRRLGTALGSIVAVWFPVIFVSENRNAIRYEFGDANLLPLMYASVGIVLLGIIFATSATKDVVVQKSPWILVGERKRITLAGAGFIALSLITFIFDLGV